MSDTPAGAMAGMTAERKALVVMGITPILLAVLWHWGRLPFFREEIVPRFFADVPKERSDLYGYYYLALSSIVTRLLIPMAVIRWVFKDKLSAYGFRVRGTMRLGAIYVGLLSIMLPILFYVSSQESFQNKYPMYRFAGDDWGTFLIYEFSYVLVFLSGEAFWRGFMVNGLAGRYGLYALPIMSIPYAMVHFGKPMSESLGAILTGLVLGYLALKHRSFWLGVALHSTIGVSMDILCLWRAGKWWAMWGL
jgi:membrane protease YdiL (CAAX protease family)